MYELKMSIDYKNKTKSELLKISNDLYSNGNYGELLKVTDLYLEYFGDMDDEDVRKMMFYNGYSNFTENKEKSIYLFEKLYDNPKTSDDLKFYSKCNLQRLYPRNNEEIPKNIHLIFFGETDFLNYHMECVNSIVENMSNYKVIIHYNKLPQNNEYWNKISSKVELRYVDIPQTFDDFELKYFQYKADVVRLELLYNEGGIYLDIDMLILKNFDEIFKDGYDFYISKEGSEENSGLINAFLASKPKNEFLKIWLNSFKTGLRMDNWAYHIRESNKILLNKHPHLFIKNNIKVLENKYFFPFKWEETHKFIDINKFITNENYGIHLFETILHNHLVNNKYFQRNYTKFIKNLPENIEIVVLTLEEYPERKQEIEKIFKRCKIDNVQYMINKKHKNPLLGCFISHIDAIRYAKNNNYDSIVIFEDDIDIKNSLATISNYPDDWDMLYFGGILTHYTEIKDDWVKGTIWCNHAYVVKKHLYDEILNIFESLDLDEMLKNKQNIDWFYTNYFHTKYNCYLNQKQPFIQKEGYSIIEDRNKWKNCKWDTWSLYDITQ
jgi:mannosyltransferase OCH1-like enzyme